MHSGATLGCNAGIIGGLSLSACDIFTSVDLQYIPAETEYKWF